MYYGYKIATKTNLERITILRKQSIYEAIKITSISLNIGYIIIGPHLLVQKMVIGPKK